MSEIFKAIVIAVIGSAAVFGFIQFLISRHDNKNDKFKEIKDDLEDLRGEMKKSIKDSVRLQLLVLLIMQPEDEKEILEVAHHYFIDLKGNWYMTPLFYKWCCKNSMKPEWFSYEE